MSKIIPFFIPHQGCPHDCVFCNQRRIAAPASPEPEEIMLQIREALEKIGPQDAEVAFYGGSFTAVSPEQQERYLDAASRFPVDIRLSTRPDAIDAEKLALLSRYRVKTIEIGAQSMSDKVLFLSNRGHTSEDTRRAAAMIKEAGFSLILQLMCGLPGDDGTYTDTARQIAQLEPDGVRIYPVAVIRDTGLFDMWQEGIYKALTPAQGAEAAADMLEVFLEHDIPVIRIGLNPTQELSSGAVAAGAYHPALGEMARSRVYLRRMIAAAGEPDGKQPTFYVNPNRISRALGIGRENIARLIDMGYVNPKVLPCRQLGEYEVKCIWS